MIRMIPSINNENTNIEEVINYEKLFMIHFINVKNIWRFKIVTCYNKKKLGKRVMNSGSRETK